MPSDQKNLKKRQTAMVIFPGKYLANLNGKSSTSILSALYGAMAKVDLSGEEWFNIIRATIPEITTYRKLSEQLNVPSFVFQLNDLGEARLLQFISYVSKKIEEGASS